MRITWADLERFYMDIVEGNLKEQIILQVGLKQGALSFSLHLG